ncbi:MBL fold hydrolase [Sporosarcina sp. NCCP-2222]|uniref:MBL fold metallo-hydrolase n=1 Tax=Sporosarcina sp. NCCP-2222 TaxID=2935073 RepID=UPI002088A01D|nr:MBL fold metallo-hydrolase [Sporosarcina sp. NCCP-2222]GKV56453.1 MBL fold hydrolase [Sporosarcina sp. NCCP-2222]
MFLKKTCIQGESSGVRYINGILSWKGVQLNVHCFETDGGLIDTGAQSLLEEFKPFFAKADIDQIIVTHAHEDHTGGAGFLQNEYGLPIYIHDMSIEECTEKAKYPLYRKWFWGKRQPFLAQPIGESFTSRNCSWSVITTPGHSNDHLAFLNSDTGQLFSGDLFVHPKTKLIMREESIPTIISSIEKVLFFEFDELFCCHAGYVKEGRKAFQSKLDYLYELRAQTLDLYAKGCHAIEIQTRLFPKKYPISRFSAGEWDSIHMINSIIKEAGTP